MKKIWNFTYHVAGGEFSNLQRHNFFLHETFSILARGRHFIFIKLIVIRKVKKVCFKVSKAKNIQNCLYFQASLISKFPSLDFYRNCISMTKHSESIFHKSNHVW
jgi:hypothetical protein